MKATGIVRRIDDLGRIVIPKEIRKTLKIHEGSPLEIFTDNEGNVIFKKYSPIGEMESVANLYAQTISNVLSCSCLISDTDKIIAIGNASKKEFAEKEITENLRTFMTFRKNMQENYDMQICKCSEKTAQLSSFITSSGDIMGVVLLFGLENNNFAFAKDYIKTISLLIGKQIE